MIYRVTITNGTFERIKLVEHNDTNVIDQESAEKLVGAQINEVWKVVK